MKPLVALWGGVGLFTLALSVAVAMLVGQQEDAATSDASQQAQRAVAAAEASVNRALIGVDLLLLHAVRSVAADFVRPGGTAEADRHLAEHAAASLPVDELYIVDPMGNVLAQSADRNPGDLPLDPVFLRRVLDSTVPQLMVSEPSMSLALSETVLYLARRVDLANGMRVVAVAQVAADLLARVLMPAEVEGVTMTLERSTGERLLSMPSLDRDADYRPAQTLPELGAAAGSEAVWQASRVNGEPAIVQARPSLFRSVWLSASVSQAEALARYRRERNVVAAATAAFVALALLAAGLTDRQIRRSYRAQQSLQRSRELLDRALASMADGFLLCDADDRVVTWNERYLELFPWLREVMAPGLPFRHLAEVAAGRHNRGQASMAPEEWIEMRMELHRRAERVWEQDIGNGVTVHAVERRTPDGGTVSVYRDLSAQEHRLREARSQAEAANEAKSQFLATMSHEIRTPLNAVIGVTDLLMQTPLDAQQRQMTGLMQRSAQNLLAIINDVLDISQIEAGRVVLEARDFDPAMLVDDVVAALRPRVADRSLDLRWEPESPGQALPALLNGDPARLRQVLFNLVGNAIKFTERGQVLVRVAADPPGVREGGGERQAEGWRLRIEVADTGPGIPASEIPRLFERFTQLDSSVRRRHGGSGLGLAITREVVRLMGGDIRVDSHVGAGSRFHVSIPMAPPALLSDPRTGAPAQATAALDILVAEDHEVNQILILAMLESLGHRATLVSDGAQALERVRERPFDVLLMDMQMPVMDGLAATRAIRALGGRAGRTPIVAMTANATTADREACFAAGMVDYVSKPLELSRLAQTLAAFQARSETVPLG